MIDQTRLARFLNPAIHLVQGAGKGANGEIDVCIMQAVDWLRGGNGEADAPPCVSPVIRKFCIRLNDSARFSEFRDELKAYATKMVGTVANAETEHKRAFMVADWAVREIAPIAMEARGRKEAAQKLRSLEPIVDKATARVADAAAYAAAYAAYAAAYAAYAAKRKIWDSALAMLQRLIDVSPGEAS